MLICYTYKLTCPRWAIVFIVFGRRFGKIFVSGVWPQAPSQKTSPFSPCLSSLLIMMPEYAGAHIFILTTFFLLSCLFIFFAFILSSIPLFSSKRKLKPAFTKFGGQEGHQKNLRRGKASDSFFTFIFFLQSFFFVHISRCTSLGEGLKRYFVLAIFSPSSFFLHTFFLFHKMKARDWGSSKQTKAKRK